MQLNLAEIEQLNIVIRPLLLVSIDLKTTAHTPQLTAIGISICSISSQDYGLCLTPY
jgi:hypothetical protein